MPRCLTQHKKCEGLNTVTDKHQTQGSTIYHIEFAKVGLGQSGGETWMVTIIKKLNERGFKNILFTTDNGKLAYEKLGLLDGINVEYRVINSYGFEQKAPLILSYIVRTFQAAQFIRKSEIDNDGYLISHSDFFPNTIPFYIASKKVLIKRRVCMMHIVCPKLFRGFENHFKGGFKFPNIRFIHHKLNQSLCFVILRKTKSTILTNSANNAKALNSICPKNKVVDLVHFAATDIEKPKKMPKRDTDIIWVGRFHKQKGIMDLPDILHEVKKSIPNLKATIVGGGDDKLKDKLVEKIDRLQLSKNIVLAGFLTGPEKDRLICSAKLFAMTSYFESHSIVILESMILGTPMVSYDLPCHAPYKAGLELTPMFDKIKFAEHITRLLQNKTAYETLKNKMNKRAKDFSWDKTTDEFLASFIN